MAWEKYNLWESQLEDIPKIFYQFQGLQSLFPQYHGSIYRNSLDNSFRLSNDIGDFYANGKVLLKDGRMGTYDTKSGHIISVDKDQGPFLHLISLYGGAAHRLKDGTWYLRNANGTFYSDGKGFNNATGKVQNYDMQTGHWIPDTAVQNLTTSKQDSNPTNNQGSNPTTKTGPSVTGSSTASNWFDKYKNAKGKFNISRTDLESWANQFGDDATKNYVKSWAGKSDRELWKNKGNNQYNMGQIFHNFTNWVKNNGGQESKKGIMNPAMSNSNFTYDKTNWTFNKGTIGQVNLTDGTANPYKSYNIDLLDTTKLDATKLANSINTKVETPLFNMNRSQTRDYMRSKGLNPYKYNGDERRALRLYMNGDTTGSGYDINILKNSDLGSKLNLKFQQGGKMDEQQMQQAFLQYLMELTGALNEQQLQQVIQQMGKEGVQKAYAEFVQAMQLQQVQAAKFGAKLNYIKRLNGQCPEGELLQYYKVGGRLCKKCMKAQQAQAEDPIKSFKCGRKMRKH